jgi:hypothetical protein
MQRRYLFMTTILVALVCVLALTPPMAGWTGAQEPGKPTGQAKTTEKEKKDKNDKEKEKKKDKEKSFEEVVEEMEKIEGLFTFYRKADEDKVLIELLPEQFDQDYIYSAKIERATGERGLYGTIMMDQFVFQWRRLGKRVQFVQKNIRFRAAPGSPAERAVKNSFSDSVLSSGKFASKPHPERKSVLVDLRDIFLAGDLHGVGQFLKRVYKTGYKFDKNNSGFVLIKSFPRNAEIGTTARFQAQEIKQASVTIPDPRSLSLHFRYSLVALPENDYRARLADDRVGYFMDMHMDYTSDKPDTPYVRYLNRWKLKKKNPKAKVSKPVEPIVFWLENSIPVEYREPIREGILLWNPAFEKAGFKNAMVVKQQPDDADWDPADIRYNTVRWFVGYDASFAIGPSHTNPYTGQIIDADIGLSEGILRLGARRRYQLYVNPVQRLQALKAEPQAMPWARGRIDPRTLCTYAQGLAEQATLAYDVMAARADWNPAKEKEFVRQYILDLVAHEVGHTLGLRHNFRASTINRMNQLGDTRRTHKVGLAASVMDYNPAVIALKGEKQGDYFPTVVGSYDHWAIEYGYKPIPGARTPEEELPELGKIAGRAADPLVPYATDEDAGLSPRALDPRNSRFDFSDQPLAWYTHEFKLVNELWANMERKLLEPGKSYTVLRRAFGYSWTPYFRGAHVAMKYIGGIYHNRDHYGDPNGRLPYVPVPAAKQREALAFLANEIWAPEVFQPPADLLNKLQFERFFDFQFSAFRAQRLDYPLHDQVLFVQSEVLSDLYHPIKMSRLQDLELKYPDPNDRFTLADMFVGVRKAIWAELDSGAAINSFRRNLQRAHLKHLVRLVLKPEKGTPEDGVTLARADLTDLAGRIDRALGGDGLDYTTRAHLEETQARIRQALEAQMQRGL